MRVLVTGACGRVGSHLIPRLLAQDEAVRVLVRNEEQAESFREHGAEAVVGDLTKPETLIEAVSGVEAIVHLAAFFRGATAAQARETNLDGTLALARAARQAGVPRFIYISTNLVYGPGRGRPTREEDEPRPPADRAYPVSKLAAEQELQELFADGNADLSILRLAFVYGEGDPHLREAINLMRGRPLTKRLHLVHHADVGKAIILSLQKPQRGLKIYNVADDTPIAFSEIQRLNGIAESSTTGAIDSDPWEGIVDTAKIKAELGFCPTYPSVYEAERANAL